METKTKIADAVEEVYAWIDSQDTPKQDPCKACGRCCDFDSFDHKLFITSPELIYFAVRIKPENIRPMPTEKCPYNSAGKCKVYQNRFAACRIFSCTSDTEPQNKISETAIKKFKNICQKFDLQYHYTDLKTALAK